jgi:hypothetical protein
MLHMLKQDEAKPLRHRLVYLACPSSPHGWTGCSLLLIYFLLLSSVVASCPDQHHVRFDEDEGQKVTDEARQHVNRGYACVGGSLRLKALAAHAKMTLGPLHHWALIDFRPPNGSATTLNR